MTTTASVASNCMGIPLTRATPQGYNGCVSGREKTANSVSTALRYFQENNMTTVAIDLPDEAFSALKRPPPEFGRRLRLAAAIHWYARGEMSMEKAALIAGLDRAGRDRNL